MELIHTLNNMTLAELAGNAALLIAALSAFIEITPIKINPLSTFMKWIGGTINVNLMERIERQDEKIDSLLQAIDENEVDRLRWEILSFASSCRNGVKHTEDEFDHIIELNEKYHKIIMRRNMTNGKIDLEYQYIISIYKRCQEKNSFE